MTGQRHPPADWNDIIWAGPTRVGDPERSMRSKDGMTSLFVCFLTIVLKESEAPLHVNKMLFPPVCVCVCVYSWISHLGAESAAG